MSTRKRLSEHAARLFAERGYHGTSVNDLALALGIRKSSIYAHIGSKEGVLAEITFAGAEAFHAALDSLPDDVPAVDALHAALRAHLHVVTSQLDVATVWLQEWRYLTGEARERFLAERQRYESRVRALFHAAVEEGSLRPDLDLKHAVLVFFSIGNWAYTWMSPNAKVDEVADAFWLLLRDGTGARD